MDPWSLSPASLQNNEGKAGFNSSYPAVPYDFFPYGGIQRSVWLYTTSKNRIEDITVTTDFDEYTQSYGIRTVKIEGDEFLLNGKPVFFKGFGKSGFFVQFLGIIVEVILAVLEYAL